MNKKTIIAMWGINIVLYIANIIIICVGGSSLFNNIVAWALAIFLVLFIMFLECKLTDLRAVNKWLISNNFDRLLEKMKEERQKAIHKDFNVEGAERIEETPQNENL